MADAKSFSLFDALSGRSYPTRDVILYLDAENAYRLAVKNREIASLIENATEPAEPGSQLDKAVKKLEREAKTLQKQVEQSALVFSLRGIPSAQDRMIRKSIEADKEKDENDWDEETENRTLLFRLLAAVLVKVTSGDAVEQKAWAEKDIEQLYDLLPPSEWSELVGALGELILGSSYFEENVDAGFLRRY